MQQVAKPEKVGTSARGQVFFDELPVKICDSGFIGTGCFGEKTADLFRDFLLRLQIAAGNQVRICVRAEEFKQGDGACPVDVCSPGELAFKCRKACVQNGRESVLSLSADSADPILQKEFFACRACGSPGFFGVSFFLKICRIRRL